MSSTPAGKFQDHYAVLGIDPKADLASIKTAHHNLTLRYDPTTDAEKYEAVSIAFEVLSDPALRKSFDKLKGVNQNEGSPRFSGPGFFDGLRRDAALRVAVLCILQDRRRSRPSMPSMSMRQLEEMLEATNDELIVALWYLKHRCYVISDDKSSLQVTADGLDYLESKQPSPELVMPLIKAPVQQQKPSSSVPPASPRAPSGEPESVLSVLNRALARS